MANFYIAVSVKQDRNETTFTERKNPEYNPGYYAFVIRCSENDNLLHSLDCIERQPSAQSGLHRRHYPCEHSSDKETRRRSRAVLE